MPLTVLAMSGGVDSSVAAKLLIDDGHDVVGVFMRHGEESPVACAPNEARGLPILATTRTRLDHKQGCCSASDAEDGRQVAERLGIPFYALNLQREFAKIMDYFVEEYISGKTPNPCVMCNNWIKFGKLFDYADSIGADFVATGHYARVHAKDQAYRLRRGVDLFKDQSYVLFGIAPHLLPRMLLPVGDYRKSDIRRLAGEIGLRVADKRDSQEICFVTTGRHAEFIANRTGRQIGGEIVTTQGQVVGSHSGIEQFTVGQRRGLGVAMGEPYFVIRIDAQTRQVIIGTHSELACTELTACRSNWFIPLGSEPLRCAAQIRYNSQAAPATVERLDESRFQVTFDKPCFGVAPGQAVVCYADDDVLGGGWIEPGGIEPAANQP